MTITARSPEDTSRPKRLARKKPLRFRPRIPGRAFRDVMEDRPLGGRFRAVRRIACALSWTLPCMLIQALLLLLPGPAKARFPMIYFRTVCWLIGMRLQVVGKPAEGRVLYVANHTSWLDIPVLGAVLDTRFISKAEVGQWPLVGWVAKLGRTVFVSRARSGTAGEAKDMSARLHGDESLVLFPEGTTSDGTRVLPFRSSFFAVAPAAHLVQPVTVVYDRMGGLPACRRDRPLFAWYGDMQTGSHAWRLLRRTGTRCTVVLHEPFPPDAIPNRKAMAAEVGRLVAISAAQLRQNRPAQPLPAPVHHA